MSLPTRRWLLFALAAAAVFAVSLVCLARTPSVAQTPELPAVTIDVPGVACAACNLTVHRALLAAGGVRRLDEGTPGQRVVVTYERGSGRPAAYVEALRRAGFTGARAVGNP